MINVLIIDDMQWIRDAIKGMLSDYPGEINIIGSVSDGEEALEIINTDKPHLVITDINMPRMDGLEFARRLKEIHSQIKVILVSGYNEFEYAKKAIQLRVDDYILKPIDKSVLHKAISKAVSEIEQEKKQQLETKDLVYKLKTADQFLKENEIYKVIESDQEISNKFIEKYFESARQNYIVLDIKIHGFYSVVDQRYSGDINAAKFSIKNIVENLEQQFYYFFFSFQKEDECILIRFGNKVMDIKQEMVYANKLKIILEQYTCMKMSIGLSSIGTDIKELKVQYDEASYALRHRLLGGESTCYCYSDLINRVSMKELLSKDDEKLIYFYTKNNENLKTKEVIEKIFEKIRKNPNMSFYSLQNLYTALILLFNRIVADSSTDYADYGGLRLINAHSLDEFDNLSDIKEEVGRAFETLAIGITQKKSDSKVNIVEMIKDYLNKYYSEDILLEEISRIYFMNPCYLSQLFKNETGQTFSQYLTRLRMEKARNILVKGNAKICDVSAQVGYNSVSHFIQSFKKIYGITPEQLRKSEYN
ncbi:MAG: response regulator [Clostridia bacterium]|nr:response regulator [Clostridia bacterium]